MILKVKYKLTVVLSLILLLFILIGSVSAADNTTNVIDNINTTDNSATVNNSLDVVTFNDYHSENLNQTISDQVLSNTYTENSTNNNNVFFSNQTIENNTQNTVLGISNDEISTLNSANPIYISPDGGGDGQSIGSPTTWDNAITTVGDGGTIIFLNGTYNSIVNVIISKNINLYHDTTTDDAILNAEGNGYIFKNAEDNTLNITGLTFVNGTGYYLEDLDTYYGGAIYSEGILNVKDSKFTNNTIINYGGAICMGNGTVINSIFTGNNETDNTGCGGAIQSYNNGKVINSTFINNTAGKDGGAISISNNGNVSDSTFIGNNASDGGAIYNGIGNLIVSNSSFINNNAKQGGAIAIDKTCNVSGCILINNAATSGNAISYKDSCTANYDWWGNNTPFAGKDYGNLVYTGTGNVIPDNWVIMGLNLSSTNITTSGSSVLVASLNQVNTSSGVVSSLPEGIVLPNRTVIFSANGGTLNPLIGNISSNASSIYTSNSTGNYTLSSTIIKL